MNTDDMKAMLALHPDGVWVPSMLLSPMAIAFARADDRFYVNDGGIAWAWFPEMPTDPVLHERLNDFGVAGPVYYESR